MVTLRPYQEEIAGEATNIMINYGFVYLAMGVRTGKTLTSFQICNNLNVSNVLFITKKKAISSIMSDYEKLDPNYSIVVINYQSLHKIPDKKYDVVIFDEAHVMSAFPKPSLNSKNAAELIKRYSPYVILMSGTPTPESFSQMYHQVYRIPGNPFSEYSSFYKFAKDYIDVKKKKIGGFDVNDYSKGSEEIIKKMAPYTINYNQAQAGFKSVITEWFDYVKLNDDTYSLIKRLEKDLVVEMEEGTILADTAVKLQSKVHQMYSGTIKFEEGHSMVIDYSKANYIRETFIDTKIAIFYKFKAEWDALKAVYGDDLTESIEEFKSTSKCIALQVVSGREGVNLSEAEFLVYYNIDFSATSYWQSRDRMTTIDRPDNDVVWVFSEGGIEKKVYQSVVKKKNYTLKHFKNDFNIK
jgi:hypothetical protein